MKVKHTFVIKIDAIDPINVAADKNKFVQNYLEVAYVKHFVNAYYIESITSIDLIGRIEILDNRLDACGSIAVTFTADCMIIIPGEIVVAEYRGTSNNKSMFANDMCLIIVQGKTAEFLKPKQKMLISIDSSATNQGSGKFVMLGRIVHPDRHIKAYNIDRQATNILPLAGSLSTIRDMIADTQEMIRKHNGKAVDTVTNMFKYDPKFGHVCTPFDPRSNVPIDEKTSLSESDIVIIEDPYNVKAPIAYKNNTTTCKTIPITAGNFRALMAQEHYTALRVMLLILDTYFDGESIGATNTNIWKYYESSRDKLINKTA